MATNPVKTHFTLTVKDSFDHYKKRSINRGKDPIPYNQYKKIILQFFYLVMTKLIMENFQFLMPYGMGIISIKAYKLAPNSFGVDMQKSVKYRKVIRYINDHTWNYSFGFIWNTDRRLFKNRKFYHFNASDTFKKMLSERIYSLANDPKKRSFIRT